MKPFENYIQYLKRLQSNYEVGTGQHNVLGIAINEAEEALRQFAVIESVCDCSNPFVGAEKDGIRKCGLCHRKIEQTVL